MSARQSIGRLVLGLGCLAGAWAALAPAAEDANTDVAVLARLKKDITFLASDECEGRGVETKGINKAADYIAEEFKKAGLKPASEAGWFQPFTMSGGAKLGSPNTLKLTGPLGQEIELDAGKQFTPIGVSGSGKLSGGVVFVGYGVSSKEAAYDDYAGQDVENKVVLMIRKAPRAGNNLTPFAGDQNAYYQALMTKIENAQNRKAAAILLVNDRTETKGQDPLIDFNQHSRGAGEAKIPVLSIRRSVADQMLQSSVGRTLKEIEEDIDRDLKPQSARLTGWSAAVDANVKRITLDVKNVVGVLEGAGPLAGETVVIGAHYDHLGYGGQGSLAQGSKAIHHGADDNASGTTSILELARRFAAKKDRQGRRLVFITFSGEEMGLLGSAHYVKKPLIPLDKTVAMVNLDMVGRLKPDDKSKKDRLEVYGTGTAKTFDTLIETLNKPYDFQLVKIAGGMGPSDHASFYRVQVPVFHFFTGTHPEYHKPTDTADKINVEGMKKVCDLVTDLVDSLGQVAERPQYVKVAGGSPNMGGPTGPRLGIAPGYGDDKDGVPVSAVSPGGPAEKGGIKNGDLIVELGGKTVKNLQTYMAVMAGFKKGEAIEVGVIRDGKKVVVKVTPE